MPQVEQPTVQEQLDFLLAVDRLVKDAEEVRRRRDTLLERARAEGKNPRPPRQEAPSNA